MTATGRERKITQLPLSTPTGPMVFLLAAGEMIKRRRSLVLEADERGIAWRGRTPH